MINNISQQNSPAFTSINVVYVPKKAFKYPDYLCTCEKEVKDIINKKNILASFITFIRNIFSTQRLHGRKLVKSESEIFKVPEQEGFHGFCVVTGKEKEDYAKQLSIINIEWVAHKMGFKNTDERGKCAHAIYFICNKLSSKYKDAPINTYKVKSLSELSSIKFPE